MRHPDPVLCVGSVLLLLVAIRPAAWSVEELPAIVRDQIAVVQPALSKAYADYRKKVGDENAKLVAVIQKAMEKATKAGKLDDALALKTALEQAKRGDLIRPYLEPSTTDLLGDDPAQPGAGPAVITLATGDPVDALAPNKPAFNNRDYLISEVSKELLGLSYALRSFKEPAPCTLKVVTAGVLYVAVGVPADGLDFAGMGFMPTDLKIRVITGELAVVSKTVRAGETITLPASAVTNSFPIWKAPAAGK